MYPQRTTLFVLLGAALCTAKVHAQALPQLVYDSTAGNLNTPAATTSLAVVDDYTSSVNTGGFFGQFQVAIFSFIGGPVFSGASTALNSTMRFTFLNQFGGLVSTTQIQFQTSGSFLRTLDVLALNLFAAEKGFFQVTTSATTSATFAFTDTAPSLGANSPTVGNPVNGIRAFSITAAGAPEPTPLAFLALGGLSLLACRHRRCSSGAQSCKEPLTTFTSCG